MRPWCVSLRYSAKFSFKHFEISKKCSFNEYRILSPFKAESRPWYRFSTKLKSCNHWLLHFLSRTQIGSSLPDLNKLKTSILKIPWSLTTVQPSFLTCNTCQKCHSIIKLEEVMAENLIRLSDRPYQSGIVHKRAYLQLRFFAIKGTLLSSERNFPMVVNVKTGAR